MPQVQSSFWAQIPRIGLEKSGETLVKVVLTKWRNWKEKPCNLSSVFKCTKKLLDLSFAWRWFKSLIFLSVIN